MNCDPAASLWHTDISGMDLLSLNMLCKTVRTGEKNKTQKKLSKEYLLSNDARNKYRLDRLETSQSRFFV